MLELEASRYPPSTIVVFGRNAVNKNQRALYVSIGHRPLGVSVANKLRRSRGAELRGFMSGFASIISERAADLDFHSVAELAIPLTMYSLCASCSSLFGEHECRPPNVRSLCKYGHYT
jgi:hypothetical protein